MKFKVIYTYQLIIYKFKELHMQCQGIIPATLQIVTYEILDLYSASRCASKMHSIHDNNVSL